MTCTSLLPGGLAPATGQGERSQEKLQKRDYLDDTLLYIMTQKGGTIFFYTKYYFFNISSVHRVKKTQHMSVQPINYINWTKKTKTAFSLPGETGQAFACLFVPW